METKEIKINVPEGYEIDTKNSTFGCIKFKPIKQVKTWYDIPNIKGYYIDMLSNISECKDTCAGDFNKNIFATEKQARSALAMAQISQLMPYYGGYVEVGENAVTITFINDAYIISVSNGLGNILRFKTKEFAKEFLKHNGQLVKDYLMIG